MAALCEHADTVAKVTILPAGLTLGATEQLPLAERHLYGAGLPDRPAHGPARRTGSRARRIRRGLDRRGRRSGRRHRSGGQMVREFGLSPALGPVGYGSGAPTTLAARALRTTLRRPYSEQTQRIVDEETARAGAASRETCGGPAARPPGRAGHPGRTAHRPRDHRRSRRPRRTPAAGRPTPRRGRETDALPVTPRRRPQTRKGGSHGTAASGGPR